MKNKVIIISGAARSGTSILGKILGSCKKVEYLYEPETFNYLSFLRNKVENKVWKNLIERYLTENFLRLVNGRSLNFRNGENSSIKTIKSNREIKLKFSKEISELDFYNYINKNKISFLIKSPNLEFSSFKKDFPNFKIIIINRNPYQVINSLMNKNWFKNKNYLKTFLPSVKINGSFYPLFMKKKYLKMWHNSNECTKCAIYLLCCEDEIKKIKNKIIIQYDDLIKSPKVITNRLLKRLGLSKSKKTHKILNNINLSKTARKVNILNIKRNIPKGILKKIDKLYK